MNGNIKFHKATSPAFDAGQVWIGSGGFKVMVVSVRKYYEDSGDYCSNYGVTYYYTEDGYPKFNEKDCWNFQVRYQHEADYYARMKNGG